MARRTHSDSDSEQPAAMVHPEPVDIPGGLTSLDAVDDHEKDLARQAAGKVQQITADDAPSE